MEQDNQNNWANLRRRMDELDQFPGDPFDTAPSWEKLHHRLEPRPRQRRVIYYRAAIILLLLTAGTGWYFSVNKPHHPAVTTPPLVKSSAQPPSIPGKQAGNKSMDVGIQLTGRSAGSDHAVVAKTKHRQAPKQLRPVNAQPAPLVIREADSLPPVIAFTQPDTVSRATVSTTPPRRLKVVHDNELNNLLHRPDVSVGSARPSRSSFSRNASDNIFQIKLSPID